MLRTHIDNLAANLLDDLVGEVIFLELAEIGLSICGVAILSPLAVGELSGLEKASSSDIDLGIRLAVIASVALEDLVGSVS